MRTLANNRKSIQPMRLNDQGHRSRLDALLHFAAIKRGQKAFRGKNVIAKLGPGGWEWAR